jgi:hypothetical protein
MQFWFVSLVFLYIARAVVEQSVLTPFVFILFAVLISSVALFLLVITLNFAFILLPRFSQFVLNCFILLMIALNISFAFMEPVYNTPEQIYLREIDKKMKDEIRENSKQRDIERQQQRDKEAKEFPMPWEKSSN